MIIDILACVLAILYVAGIFIFAKYDRCWPGAWKVIRHDEGFFFVNALFCALWFEVVIMWLVYICEGLDD